MSRLTANVWVGGSWYGPSYPGAGQPPAGTVRPDLFDDADDHADDAVPRAAEVTAPPVDVGPADPPPAVAAVDEEPPPLAGKGATRAAWAAYAQRHRVTVNSDDGRDEIVDACRAAGVPVD